jgi:hypothetical protein
MTLYGLVSPEGEGVDVHELGGVRLAKNGHTLVATHTPCRTPIDHR